MTYTEEEIEKYMKILKNYKKNNEIEDNKFRCKNCQSDSFTIDFGQYVCEECGVLNGNVLGYFNIKEKDRLFYRKKSIYNRKYYYQKNISKIFEIIKLTDTEKNQLYTELMKINDSVMEIQNKYFCRKRMINIFYLIKKILQEMGNEKYKLVNLKISPQTFKYYEKWWENYLSIRVK